MCQASGDTAVGMTEPAPLPSRQVRKTDTHRETNTVSSIKLVSAKRSQQQQMHSGVLDAWRGPGDFSEDLVKSAHQTYKHLWNRLSGRRNSKCKGPEANCVLLVFYVCTLALPFEIMEITIIRPFICVQTTAFNQFLLVLRYKQPREGHPHRNLWPVTSCTKVPTNKYLRWNVLQPMTPTLIWGPQAKPYTPR